MEHTVKGFGKLLLFGEHSALYGFPAIGIPLPQGITLHGRCDHKMEAQDLHCDSRFFNTIKQLITTLTSNSTTRGYRIEIQSDLPESRGFGSSAALCTALAKFFYPELKGEAIWQKAHELEFHFHGRASGIDTGLSLADSLTWFNFGDNLPLPKGHRISQKLGIWIVPGSVPREESTKQLVAAIGNRVQENHKTTIAILKNLGTISEIIIKTAGHKKDWSLWSRLTREAHDSLKKLRLYNSQMNEIFQIAASLGNPPGKLSGAGGGGAFYFVFPEKKKAMQFYEQFSSACALTPRWSIFSPIDI